MQKMRARAGFVGCQALGAQRSHRTAATCRRTRWKMKIDREEVKSKTALLNVYSIADKEGYPVLQQMFNEATIGSLYFLSCRQAMLVLKDLKESGASFADGAQVAVIPFHIAYDNVVADPIETEDRDEKGRIVSIIFRFVPDFSELGEAKRMLEEQGQSLDSIPEVPVFFKDVKNAEAKTLFISHQDCDGYFEEGFAELPRLLGDLSTFLESGERVTVIPSTENMEYVNSIFDKAGFNQ